MIGNGKLSRAERAIARQLREQAPKPKARPTYPEHGFNAVRFYTDLMAAGRQLGVAGSEAIGKDAGVRPQAIRTMRYGLAPTLGACLALCDWAGLDPLQYLIRIAPEAANDAQARNAA